MKAKVAYLVEPGRFEIREDEIQAGEGQVILKIASCGLCNWELHHWKGQLGELPMPLGHEAAGVVVECGEGVTTLKIGDKATGIIMGSFSDYLVANVDEIIKLADHVDERYALCEPLKCITTVTRAATPETGDVGVVVGCGPMGLWAIQALNCDGLSALIAVDIDDNHLALAKKFGATHTINSLNEDVASKIAEISNGHMADFVIEGTGNSNVLNDCVTYIRQSGRGRLVIMSTYQKAVNFTNIHGIIERSLQIIVAHPDYSNDAMDDLRRTVDLVNRGVYKVEELITHVFKLSEINEAFRTLENKPKNYIKGMVIPD